MGLWGDLTVGDIRTRFNISSTVLGVLLLGSLTTCQPTQQPRLDAGRTEIRFSNYRVLFDRNQEGHPASGGTLLYVGGELSLVFQRASDGDSGVQATLARSQDGGKTWSVPAAFGPPVESPDTAFQACGFVGITGRGTTIASGFHNYQLAPQHGIDWAQAERPARVSLVSL